MDYREEVTNVYNTDGESRVNNTTVSNKTINVKPTTKGDLKLFKRIVKTLCVLITITPFITTTLHTNVDINLNINPTYYSSYTEV